MWCSDLISERMICDQAVSKSGIGVAHPQCAAQDRKNPAATCGNIAVEPDTGKVYRDGEPIAVTKLEYKILMTLFPIRIKFLRARKF